MVTYHWSDPESVSGNQCKINVKHFWTLVIKNSEEYSEHKRSLTFFPRSKESRTALSDTVYTTTTGDYSGYISLMRL